jgi:hypothetical protein
MGTGKGDLSLGKLFVAILGYDGQFSGCYWSVSGYSHILGERLPDWRVFLDFFFALVKLIIMFW